MGLDFLRSQKSQAPGWYPFLVLLLILDSCFFLEAMLSLILLIWVSLLVTFYPLAGVVAIFAGCTSLFPCSLIYVLLFIPAFLDRFLEWVFIGNLFLVVHLFSVFLGDWNSLFLVVYLFYLTFGYY